MTPKPRRAELSGPLRPPKTKFLIIIKKRQIVKTIWFSVSKMKLTELSFCSAAGHQ